MTQPLFPARRWRGSLCADPARLRRRVRQLCEEFFPRDFGHPENLKSAAAYIREEFQSVGAKVTCQVFSAGGGNYRNVIASFGPETEELIVVGAHYDTDGELPGADDNASGVAGLLELAHGLCGAQLHLRVELVAYALEEMPFFGTAEMGSAVHARELQASGRRARAMLCLEMIGCFSDDRGSQQFPFPLLRLFYPGRGNFIAVVGNLRGARLVRRVKRAMRRGTDLPVRSINAPALVPGVDLSDHVNYWRLGDPAVMITDTAFYRNDRYHTERDTPETLDYTRMADVVHGLFRAVLDLAG
ncbi:MAG: M28 family peptidase [Thermoanaerobaculia bacterium]